MLYGGSFFTQNSGELDFNQNVRYIHTCTHCCRQFIRMDTLLDAAVDKYCPPYSTRQCQKTVTHPHPHPSPSYSTVHHCSSPCLQWGIWPASLGYYLTVACFFHAIHTVPGSHREPQEKSTRLLMQRTEAETDELIREPLSRAFCVFQSRCCETLLRHPHPSPDFRCITSCQGQLCCRRNVISCNICTQRIDE